MPRRAPRSTETRPVSFRMPIDVYNELSEIAEGRGVDLSAVLNWICADYLPQLRQKEADRKQALIRAKSQALSDALAADAGTGQALEAVRELLKQMQDVYAALAKRALEEDRRREG